MVLNDLIIQWFLDLIDSFLDAIYDLAESALSILPDSPIQSSGVILNDGPFSNVLAYINYFVPVGAMLGILTGYLTAVAVWYIVRWLMRLSRYIQ